MTLNDRLAALDQRVLPDWSRNPALARRYSQRACWIAAIAFLVAGGAGIISGGSHVLLAMSFCFLALAVVFTGIALKVRRQQQTDRP